MMVLVLTASPPGLRGDLTKWLLEISPGVFVGNVNPKIRESLWKRVVSLCRDGRALLVYSSNKEQSLEFLVHDHSWQPVDLDGATLMRRPSISPARAQRTGWSAANAQRRARKPAWKRRFDNSGEETASDST